jgi:hypothetical protein
MSGVNKTNPASSCRLALELICGCCVRIVGSVMITWLSHAFPEKRRQQQLTR